MGWLEQALTSPLGRRLAARAGLVEPPILRRGRTEPEGPLVLANLPGGDIAHATLGLLGLDAQSPLYDVPEARTTDTSGRERPPSYRVKPGALIVDATGLSRIDELELVRQVLRPAVRGLANSGRIIVLGPHASGVEGLEARAVVQALDGINRTVGKELRGGSTSNLVQILPGTSPADLASTVSFLLQGRSAFVSGQTWVVGAAKVGDEPVLASDPADPFDGRVVVVTGAARGIGAAIARTFARDGARVVAVDVPAAGEALASVANQISGSALQVDITDARAGHRIAEHVVTVYGAGARIHAIVHNAGITRDKMLANLDETLWASVLAVNLAAEIRINDILLQPRLPGGLAERARIIGVASTSGVAGNKGQTNYAASKAGVMGLVWAETEELAGRPITANAVAPGFIETDMTAAIPYLQREVFRRTNSLSQGGQPGDVAETIAWLADPSSGGVNGQVIRVCGQNLVGA